MSTCDTLKCMSHPFAPADEDYERECVLYLRKSKGRAGIPTQRRDGEREAARLRWRIVAEFVDVDATAFSKVGAERAKRDDYTRMLAMLRADKRDVPLGVIGWHADRIHRNTAEVEGFIEICAAGMHPVQTVRSGGYELWTPTGRKRIRNDAVDAAYEVDHLIDRVESRKREKALAGRWSGGPVPFGWKLVRPDPDQEERELVLDPPMAEAIRWGSEAVVRGASLRSVAREWNKRGLRRTLGQTWDSRAVRRTLLKPRNAGLVVDQGQIIESELPGGKAEWEPIISEELWRAVEALVTDPTRRTSPGPAPRWLGSGLYLCGPCGGVLRVATNGAKNKRSNPDRKYPPVYRCFEPGNGHVARQAAAVDLYVESVLIARLSQPDVMAVLSEEQPADVDEIRARLAVQEAELASWRRLAEDGEVSAVAFAKSEKAVLARISDIKAELVAVAGSPLLAELVTADDVEALWESHREDLWWRRAVLDMFVTVSIDPPPLGRPVGWTPGDPYFHTDAIRFEWKQLGVVSQ